VDNLNKAIAGSPIEQVADEIVRGIACPRQYSRPGPENGGLLESLVLLKALGPKGRRAQRQNWATNQGRVRFIRRFSAKFEAVGRAASAVVGPGSFPTRKLKSSRLPTRQSAMGKAVAGCEGKPILAWMFGNTPTTQIPEQSADYQSGLNVINWNEVAKNY
jgi:hypothetical protein